jgi:hypothetical protein
MGVLLAVLSAVSNAVANVLERSVARDAPPELSMRLTLFRELARHRRWVIGMSMIFLTFALQAAALGFAAVSLVQPLVVLELPLTVAGSGLLLEGGLARRDWLAVLGLVAGVITLLVALSPGPARHPAATPVLLVVLLGGGALVLLLIGVALRVSGDARAAFLGAAGGVTVGLTAVFMREMSRSFVAGGLVGVFTTWESYAMAGFGIAGLYLAQNAYHAGRLVASQPGLTIADPTTGLLVGVLALGEPVSGGWHDGVAVAGGVLMAVSTVGLARSPALADRGAAAGQR